MSKASDLLNILNESEDWKVHKKAITKAGFDLHSVHRADFKHDVHSDKYRYPQQAVVTDTKMSNGQTMVISSAGPDYSRQNFYHASVKNANGTIVKQYALQKVGASSSISAPKSTTVGNDPKAVLDEIKAAMRMAPEGRQATFRGIEQNGKYYEFDVRYWGSWKVPDDEQDDDDGDYDFEVLTDKSAKSLQNIVQPIIKKYPALDIYYQTGEKNYITVHAAAK